MVGESQPSGLLRSWVLALLHTGGSMRLEASVGPCQGWDADLPTQHYLSEGCAEPSATGVRKAGVGRRHAVSLACPPLGNLYLVPTTSSSSQISNGAGDHHLVVGNEVESDGRMTPRNSSQRPCRSSPLTGHPMRVPAPPGQSPRVDRCVIPTSAKLSGGIPISHSLEHKYRRFNTVLSQDWCLSA